MNNQSTITDNSEIRFFVVLVVILSILLLASLIFNPREPKNNLPVLSEITSRSFSEINLIAKAVYVYDARTKTVLFAKNENARLSLASLTKIMSSLVAEDSNPLFSVISISDEALKSEGNGGVYKDEKWSLKNLIDFSLMTSSNDGIRAVALALGALSSANATPDEIINNFVGQMNQRAAKLGLKNTYFLNVTGLDLSTTITPAGQVSESNIKGGAYGTARDMGILLEYILINRPELLEATGEISATFFSIDNRPHLAKNTNTIANEIPGLIASKTGLTDTAGGNLTFIFDPELGRPIIVTILGSTEKGRFEDARTLISTIMEHIGSN